MIIYHGSKNIISKPCFGIGNPKNDYGLGFYCTENIELAKEWACTSNIQNGYANIYELDIRNLKILDLRDYKYSILNWLAILLKHRTFDCNNSIAEKSTEYLIDNFYIDVESYDVVIGYRADDSYFSFAKDFINNTINLNQLSRAMKLGNLGIQIVLKSENAIAKIKFISYETAISKEYYIKRLVRDQKARLKYFNDCRLNDDVEGLFMIDIVRKGLKNNDEIL
jgi:hypothetical protein